MKVPFNHLSRAHQHDFGFRDLRTMAPLSPTRASRKYVDLINRSSGSFVNWDPMRRLEVG